jgi:hypothetical protein
VSWLLVIRYSLLVIGYWLLVIGYWLLPIDKALFKFIKIEIFDEKMTK